MWILQFLPNWIFYAILLIGVAGFAATYLLKFIPIPAIYLYKTPIQLGSIALIVIGVYMSGAISNEESWKAKVAEVQAELAKKETASAEVTTKIVTKYVKQIETIKEKGDVIIKEIPTYITKVDDSKCAIPNGFVLLHDSASKNEVPDTSRSADAGASSVKLSDVAETVTINYTTYHKVAEQLKSLQTWIKEQQQIYK
jgi:hypothetical protein